MSHRQWFQLSQKLVQVYSQSDISYKYKKLPLQYFYISSAPFSGPIAILYNKYVSQQTYKLPQSYDKSILVFNSKGQLKKLIPFEMKDRIIMFKFTQLEELIIVYASGQYVLIDPFSSKRHSGTFFGMGNELNSQVNQRCIGADMFKESDGLFIIKERTFGIVKSFNSYWSPIIILKPNIDNPVFNVQKSHNNSIKKASSMIFLTKDLTIDEYNPSTNIKRTIFENNNYLDTVNYKNLLCISKSQNILAMVFLNPFKLYYIDLEKHKKSKNQGIIVHDVLIDIKTKKQIQKSKSKHHYKSLNDQILWLDSIAIYSNGKILILFDQKNLKAIYSTNTDSKLANVVIQQVDGIRVICQENILYREMNNIYQLLVSIESLQDSQRALFRETSQIIKSKQTLKQRFLNEKQINVENFDEKFCEKQKMLIIHELHTLYQKYINREMIPLNQLEQLKKYSGPLLKYIVQNGIKCLDKLQLIKIFKFATFIQNYYTFSNITLNERQSQLRISQIKQNQPQMYLQMNGNLSSFLSTPIYELCAQLRVINTLKYSYLKRFLTIQQFHILKYQMKDNFTSVLLRYNMHYELDLIFGDSITKAKIFYHWSKCKIQRQQNTSQQSLENTESYIYQQIIEKYESLKNKLISNNQLFSQIAKYCIERNKLNLGLKLLQYQNDHQRRILVGLLILVAKKDKHLVEKIIQFTEKSKKSQIVYRVIKQLLSFNWIEKHLWTNIFHNKLVVEEHYIKYNEYMNLPGNIKDYYLQNKMLIDLGFMGIKQVLFQFRNEKIQKLQSQGQYIDVSNDLITFNFQETQNIKEKLVSQYSSIIPNMCQTLKKHSPKVRKNLQQLNRLKNKVTQITQADITQIQPLKDIDYEYLGQIISEKDNNDQLSTKVYSKIKSQKCYKILMKRGKWQNAIQLAHRRRNLDQLKQILQICSQDHQPLCRQRIRDIQRTRNK